MSDLTELKAIAEEGNRALEAFREKSATKEDLKDVVRAEEVKRIQEELTVRLLAEQSKRAELETKMTDLETAVSRPLNGSGAARSDEEKAFDDYLRSGDQGGLDKKSMATTPGTDGGFLVPPSMREGIQSRQRRWSPIRTIARIDTGVSSPHEIIVERGEAGIEWNGEKQAPGDTATPTVHKIAITLHDLSALPKVSQRLLDMADFDLEAWLSERIANRFARAEGSAFVVGSGVDRPKGFTQYPTATAADATRADEKLQHRVSGASGAFASAGAADPLVKLFYDLQGVYQANATWIMKSSVAGQVATLKDDRGAYLLQGMMNESGQFVRMIMGRPLLLAEDMPDIAAGSLSIAVGDFDAGYTIAEGAGVRILRDPYSAKPNIQFYTTKRVGGGVTDFDAIKFLKFSA